MKKSILVPLLHILTITFLYCLVWNILAPIIMTKVNIHYLEYSLYLYASYFLLNNHRMITKLKIILLS